MQAADINTAMQRPAQAAATSPAKPWLMLISRPVLFFIFQGLIALVLSLAGNPAGWDESPRYWPFMVILANLVSVILLVRLFRAEGRRYLDLFRFNRATLKTDLLWLVGTSIIGLPVAAAPMGFLATAIFGDSMAPVQMLFRPLPVWALALSFLFPLTIPFAELPTYFGYVMPRLAVQLKNGWAAWLISAFVLGLQHSFLPFIPDARFFAWRLGMYLPFALFAGLVLKLRPSLMPYFVVVHGLIDISALTVYWMV
jgi:hypothetical protein